MSIILRLLLIISLTAIVQINAQGYEAYGGGSPSAVEVDSKSSNETLVKAPEAPIEPPRLNSEDADLINEMHSAAAEGHLSNNVDASSLIHNGPSLGYRPPPPPTRRDEESQGQCTFDTSKWSIEPESAISQGIMFDRTTGLNCDQCLAKCVNEFQNPSSAWVCRSVTYDHTWKICDLFAINGTEYPHFLTVYHGRDYFSYLAALPPTDEHLNITKKLTEFKKQKSSSASSESDEKKEKHKTSDLSRVSLGPCVVTQSETPSPTTTQSPSTEILFTAPPSLSVLPSKITTESDYASETDVSISETPETPSPSISVLESSKQHVAVSATIEVPNPQSDADAKSYGSKIQEFTDENNNNERKEQSPNNLQKSIKIQSLKNLPENLKNRNSKHSQFNDFDTALETLQKESEIANAGGRVSSDTNSPSFSVTSNSFGESYKPKYRQIIKNTLSETPNHSSTQTEIQTLSSSIHTIPISGNTAENNEQSSIIQERSESSFSSSSSSSSHNSTSFHSSSSSSLAQPTEVSSSVFSHNTKLNGERELHRAQGVTSLSFDENSLSAASNCGANEKSRYMVFDGFERSRNFEKKGLDSKSILTAKTINECIEACDSQRAPACASVVFSTTNGCELYYNHINHNVEAELSPSSTSQYAEKSCIPLKLAQGILKTSLAFPKHILVGHVQEVTDAKTFVECQISCLRSELEFGFVCKSAMWYPQDNDQNCLLNAENRHTQPDVFVTEDPGVVMYYFELTPNIPFSALQSNSIHQLQRFRDIPLNAKTDSSKASKWTHWSNCKHDASSSAMMRTRYLKCNEKKDIRKCPKESVFCGDAQTLHIQKISKIHSTSNNTITATTETTTTPVYKSQNVSSGECYAVRDALGRKHCPYGMRLQNGRREFCRTPVDCP